MAITTNVPSDRFEDLQRDVQDATRFSNGTAVFQNRTGESITPIPLRDQQFETALSNVGYIYKDPDTFTTGSTLNGPNEALRRASDGEYFRRVQGPYPYTVAPGTDPTTDPLYVAVGSASLAANLAAVDSNQLVGGVEAGKIDKSLENVSQMKALSGLQPGSTVSTFYHTSAPYGGGKYLVVTPSQYQTYTGLTVADGYRDHALVGGNIAMLMPQGGVITAQQCGAVPFTNDQTSADKNTEAFRYACVSYESEWNALKSVSATNKRVWDTTAESGDYLLSNGFTVPKGWSLRGGSLGSTRLKILPGFASSNPIPVLTIGKSINASGETVTHSGIYVTNPPPFADSLYINPQDVRVGIDCGGTPGFSFGTLWLQAATCIAVNGGDGVFGRLFLEAGSSEGLVFSNCQNMVVDEIYTFDMNNPVIFTGSNTNNINIGLLQCNYTRVAAVETKDGATIKAASIKKLVVNQNAQFASFTSCVRLRSSSIDLKIDEMECYNYNGWAVDNETGLGNVVNIGKAKLRQDRNNAMYDQGTTARGFRVNNSEITVDVLDSALSDYSIGELAGGTFTTRLTVNRAILRSQAGGTVCCNITHLNPATGSRLELFDIDNRTNKPLFNQSGTVTVSTKRLNNPFPVISEGGRQAIKIPFRGAGLYRLVIRANSNPGGNSDYKKVWAGYAGVDTTYTSQVVLNASLQELFSSAFGEVFAPKIAPQVDINSVGTGPTIPNASSGLLVISVPSSYQALDYSIDQELFS